MTEYSSLESGSVPKRYRSLCCASSVIAVLAVAAAVALAVDDAHQRDKANNASNPTPEEMLRRDTSAAMKANMNFDVSPCDDFYEYSCGGWLKRTTIPADKKQVYYVMGDIDTSNQHILKSVLNSSLDWAPIAPYYRLCMNDSVINAAGIDPLYPYLTQINLLDDANQNYASALINVTAQLHLIGINAFWSYSSGADLYNPKQNIGQWNQGGIQLGVPYYTPNMSDPEGVGRLTNYTHHIQNMLSFVDDPTNAALILDFETALANKSMTTVQQRDIAGTYHKYNLTGLESISSLPWRDYLTNLGVPTSDLSDPSNYLINVASVDFLKGMEKLISVTPINTIKSYLRWTLIHGLADLLTDPISQENFNFFGKVMNGIQQQKSRQDRCVAQVDLQLGQILGKYYIQQAFTSTAKDLAIAMMKAVKTAMGEKLETVDFMKADKTGGTRQRAENKLNMLSYQIGYPDHWKSYDKLTLDHSSYFQDTINIMTFLNRETFTSVNKPVDRNAWGMTTPTVNAYYDPPTNQLVIPAGILQGLYFNELFHPAINFGGTGGTQGHEMTHGFDDQGSQYDGTGNFTNWWAQPVVDKWNTATQCLSDFYSQYLVLDEPNYKLHLDGNLTNGENIADVGGVKQAFHAYQNFLTTTKFIGSLSTSEQYFDWLTNDQLFFVSYAQGWCEKSTRAATIQFQSENPHAPGKFRVNGPVTQNPDFARLFNCPVGKSAMAPEPSKLCDIW